MRFFVKKEYFCLDSYFYKRSVEFAVFLNPIKKLFMTREEMLAFAKQTAHNLRLKFKNNFTDNFKALQLIENWDETLSSLDTPEKLQCLPEIVREVFKPESKSADKIRETNVCAATLVFNLVKKGVLTKEEEAHQNILINMTRLIPELGTYEFRSQVGSGRDKGMKNQTVMKFFYAQDKIETIPMANSTDSSQASSPAHSRPASGAASPAKGTDYDSSASVAEAADIVKEEISTKSADIVKEEISTKSSGAPVRKRSNSQQPRGRPLPTLSRTSSLLDVPEDSATQPAAAAANPAPTTPRKEKDTGGQGKRPGLVRPKGVDLGGTPVNTRTVNTRD